MSTQILVSSIAANVAGSSDIVNEALAIHSGIWTILSYTEKTIFQLRDLLDEFSGLRHIFSKTSKKNRHVIKPIITMFEKLLGNLLGIKPKDHPATNYIFRDWTPEETESVLVSIFTLYSNVIILLRSFKIEADVALSFNYVSLNDYNVVSETKKRIEQIINEYTFKLTQRFPSLASS
jgi:hypothetical protein